MKRLALRNKQRRVKAYALVDDCDYPRVRKFRWYLRDGLTVTRKVQVRAGSKKTWISFWLHREIMRPPADLVVDHINGNVKDNRRANLRICTRNENLFNKVRQPMWEPRYQIWEAVVRRNLKTIYLGSSRSWYKAARMIEAYKKQVLGFSPRQLRRQWKERVA